MALERLRAFFRKKKPMQIAFENRSRYLSNIDAQFQIAACDIAMRRDFAPAWKFEAWPCVLYKNVKLLPAGSYHPMFIMDNIGAPDALGFHDDQLSYIYGRVLAQGAGTSVTDDHEAKEMRLDPECNLYLPMPNGLKTAKEACDAVEGDTYNVDVTIAGETRSIPMSNFILPAWFDANDKKGPYDYLGKLVAPFSMTPGGYMIVMHPNGKTEDIFADHETQVNNAPQGFTAAHIKAAAASTRRLVALKRADQTSRTYRRHAKAEMAQAA